MVKRTDSQHEQVAKELAAADIPLIFTAAHGAPDTWEKKDTLAGPPLTESPVKVLSEANVTFGLAFPPESMYTHFPILTRFMILAVNCIHFLY